MELQQIERIIREHSRLQNKVSQDLWLTPATVARYRDSVPVPGSGETTLMDIGCYQPAIGYYAALGWRTIIGISREDGECNSAFDYTTENSAAVRNVILDIETQRTSETDGSVDVVLMMEVFEHFGLDPMHALTEANRVLKPNGLLVFSTPNATSRNSLQRIMRGDSPHTGLEFSGFSTNRHNRIYDCNEIRNILTKAGFQIEVCTSRTYEEPHPGLGPKVINILSNMLDIWMRFRRRRLPLNKHQQIERGDCLIVNARKIGKVLERYPAELYFNPELWPDWYQAIRERGAANSVVTASRR